MPTDLLLLILAALATVATMWWLAGSDWES